LPTPGAKMHAANRTRYNGLENFDAVEVRFLAGGKGDDRSRNYIRISSH
jgi:hypothetical protein